MKRLAKRLSHHTTAYRPRVERLEVRSQPGTVLSNPGSLLGLSLDLGAPDVTPDNQNVGLASLRRIMSDSTHQADALAAALGQSAAHASPSTPAVVPTAAPVQHVSSGLSLADQSVAVNAGRTAGQQGSSDVGRNHVAATYQALSLTTSAVPANAVRHADLQVNTTHNVGAATATINFSTLLGAAGTASLLGIARDAGGNTYVTGTADLTGSGKQDALVAKYDSSGTQVWVDDISLGGPSNEQASGVAVSADGSTLYVAGTLDDGSGDTSGIVGSISTADGSVSGAIAIMHAQLTGVALDTAGNVYTDGSTTAQSATPQRVLAAELDSGLTTAIYAVTINTNDPSLTTSSGSIAVDPAGNAYVTGQDQAADQNRGLILRIDAGGMNIPWALAFNNPNPGPAGTLNGVIYSNNFVYAAGTVNNTGGATRLSEDLLIVKANAATGDLTTGGYAWDYFVDDRTPAAARVGDWTGDGVALTGAAGNELVVATSGQDPVQYPPTDPPTQGLDVCPTHFSVTGDATTEHPTQGDPENCFGGSSDDLGHGLVYSGGQAYITGGTASADFPTTDGTVFGGGATDGFFSQVSVR